MEEWGIFVTNGRGRSGSIRPATVEDAAAILGIYAPVVQGSVATFELEPPPVGEMARRIVEVTRRYPWLLLEVSGEVAGYAYAAAYHRLFETHGFERIGTARGIGYKLGRWVDVDEWQLELSPRGPDPRPPSSP